MESIFENLENLNVSEECFNDIMGIVEDILGEHLASAIDRSKKSPSEKKDLLIKAALNKNSETDQFRGNRQGGSPDITKAEPSLIPKNIREYGTGLEKAGDRITKNFAGQEKTRSHRKAINGNKPLGYPFYLSDKMATGSSFDDENSMDNWKDRKNRANQQELKASAKSFRKHLEKKTGNKLKNVH